MPFRRPPQRNPPASLHTGASRAAIWKVTHWHMLLDDYGYPPPPDARWKLRKKGIRASKTVLSACLYVCMCVVGAILWLVKAGRRLPPLSLRSVQPRRLLVIRLDLIGDLV